MALIELSPDDLCTALSFPFPCEEGKIIDPIGAAHALGLVETTAAVFDDSSNESGPGTGERGGDPAFAAEPKADRRLLMLSFACSMEANEVVTQARAKTRNAAKGGAERVSAQNALDAFVDGVIASPPVLATVLPPPGSVVVIGTVTVKIPTPPPVPPHWEEGEQLARAHLLALATRFQSASKMSGIGDAAAEDLAAAAARLIDAAIAR